jgi:hypothetical protein
LPTFDEQDADARDQFARNWNRQPGPRVGDFIRMAGGEMRRFTHHWGDGLQTSGAAWLGSFYMSGGTLNDRQTYVSYSGSLEPSIPLERIAPTGEVRNGTFWFFHHQRSQAHNDVHFTVPCRVYREKAIGEGVPSGFGFIAQREGHGSLWDHLPMLAVRKAVGKLWYAVLSKRIGKQWRGMAKAAAPFLHPRMQPSAPSTDDGLPVRPVINLTITRGPSTAEGDKQAALGVIKPALQKLN